MSQLYCRVKDGLIKEGPRSLPRNTARVSNLRGNPAIAKQYGWLPYSIIEPVLGPNEKKTGIEYIIQADSVMGEYSVNELSTEDQDLLESNRILSIREATEKIILGKFSTYEQCKILFRLNELNLKAPLLSSEDIGKINSLNESYEWIKKVEEISKESEINPSGNSLLDDVDKYYLYVDTAYNEVVLDGYQDKAMPKNLVIVNPEVKLSDTEGKFNGKALEFSGDDDCLINIIPKQRIYEKDFVIEFFIKIKQNNIDGTVVFNCQDYVEYDENNHKIGHSYICLPLIKINGNRVEVNFNSVEFVANTTFNMDEWYHLAFVKSGTEAKVFINGIAENTMFTDCDSSVNYLSFTLGTIVYFDRDTSFEGYLDQFRLSIGSDRGMFNGFNPPTESGYGVF